MPILPPLALKNAPSAAFSVTVAISAPFLQIRTSPLERACAPSTPPFANVAAWLAYNVQAPSVPRTRRAHRRHTPRCYAHPGVARLWGRFVEIGRAAWRESAWG